MATDLQSLNTTQLAGALERSASTHVQSEDILSRDRKSVRIGIIGAGATGSFTALALAKMGFTDISIWDFDKVERHNTENQMYGHTQVGMKKVQALKWIVQLLSGVSLKTFDARFPIEKVDGKETSPMRRLLDVVVIAVDNMKTRQEVWEDAKGLTGGVSLYIDSRMGAEVVLLYTVNMKNFLARQRYETTLHGDEEAAPVRCTEKSIMYTPFVLGGLIARSIKTSLMGIPNRENIVLDLKMLTLAFLGKDDDIAIPTRLTLTA